jgi:hypothetical protein
MAITDADSRDATVWAPGYAEVVQNIALIISEIAVVSDPTKMLESSAVGLFHPGCVE